MAKRGGFPGGGMPGNMANLMKQAQKMQRQMEEQAKELESKEFTATAGGGAVEVTVSGTREVTKVKLQEEVVDPDDIEMLEDLIVAATNEALRKVEAESASAMSKLTGGLGGGNSRDAILRSAKEMDYYSSQISKLIEELSRLPGIGAKSAQRLAFSYYQHAERASAKSCGLDDRGKGKMYAIVNNATRLPIRNCARSAATVIVMQRQSWWWRRRGIWRLTKRQENIKESIMCFTVRSRQCLGLDLETSN